MTKRLLGLATLGTIAGFVAVGLGIKQAADKELLVEPELHNPVDFSLRDWKRVLSVVKTALGDKNLSILAAGVAYFSTLAFFPLLAAAVAIAALAIAPDQLHSVVDTVNTYLPKDVAKLVSSQLQTLVGKRSDNVLAAVIAIALSLFSASGASKNLVAATNVAYGVKASHGWLKQQLRGLGWTIGGIMFGFVVAVLIILNKAVLAHIGVVSPYADVLLIGRWLLIVLLMAFGLAFFYRYGPNRHRPRWQWISWGAVTSTVLWLGGTALFFVYVQNFGNYGRSYSLFAGIIILMVWLNLTAFTVLLGAAVNHGLEKAAARE